MMLTQADREKLVALDIECLCGCADGEPKTLADLIRSHSADMDRESVVKVLLEVGRYLAQAPCRDDQLVGVFGGAIAQLSKDLP